MVQSWKSIAYWSLCCWNWVQVKKMHKNPICEWQLHIEFLLHSVELRKQIQTTKSSNSIGLKQKFSGLHVGLFCWTLKIMVHFHYSFEILTNVLNLITQLTIGSLKLSKKNNSDHQIKQFHWSIIRLSVHSWKAAGRVWRGEVGGWDFLHFFLVLNAFSSCSHVILKRFP
jgi:hypothetical protein